MTAGWLEVVGARATLPYGLSNSDFAQRVARQLLGQRNREVDEILAKRWSADRVEEWAKLLDQRDSAELVEFFAYRPGDVFAWLAPELPEIRRWSTLAEIYVACFSLAVRRVSESGSAPELAYAGRVMAGHLARTRWALLSLPFTSAPRPHRKDLGRVDDDTGRLIALARQARDDWLAVLAAIEDYPQLVRQIGDVEADIGYLVAIIVSDAGLEHISPGGTTRRDEQADPPGREAASFAVTRLLLPRFAWCMTARAYCRLANRWSLGLSIAALAGVLIALTLFGLASVPHWSWAYTAAALSAAAVYLLVTAAIAVDARVAWPWLLRQPASAAVGLLALAAFGSDWWHTAGAHGATTRAVIAAVILAGMSVAYLYVEAAGHRVRGMKLARRPLVVGFFGLMHSLLVSLIGLRFLLPVFAAVPPGGPAISCWYATRACNGQVLPGLVLVALAATWSFASGVFLQIIWDDQPVTAPLAHVSWHRGG